MRIGVLGTGTVGQTLSSSLAALGHEVVMGSRTSPPATFAEAASFGELVLNCTAGVQSLDALRMAGAESLSGKVVVDVANPLDFSQGFPPQLSVPEGDSLAEQIQRELPRSRVVKALNTVTASVMVDPGRLTEPTDLFIAGDDEAAKEDVKALLSELGWAPGRVRDLGGLESARVIERYLLLWLALMGVMGTAEFNVRVVGVDTTP